MVGLTCKRYGLPRGRVGGTPAFWWVVVMLASAACFVLRDWMGVWAVAMAATTVVVVALITPASQSMFAEAWSFLGDASYSIYLTHNIILLVGAKGWVFLWGPSAYVPAIFILGALAVAGGSLAHVFVEKPIIAYATRRLLQQKPSLERV